MADATKDKSDPEEQAAAAAAPEQGGASGGRQKWVVGLVIVALVGIVLAITLPLTLSNNGSSSDDSSASSTAPPTAETSSGTAPPPDTALGRIYNAGVLKCGIPMERPGFATLNQEVETQKDYIGFDADLCKAVAAAIFGDAEPGRMEHFPVSATDRFHQLNEGVYDMLARVTTHTMQREVMEVGSAL
jgi:ABC-type amino acid transport substrate-binding protein